MAKDAPTQPDDRYVPPEEVAKARETRAKQGPFQVTLPADFDQNPALPHEVWPQPPAGSEPPKFE